ncbi:MAG TPA: hypothetical protein VK858_21435 [Longimicrobiales bacterium]|nr:hypothetical protein [Longimicrobiales bacterium]
MKAPVRLALLAVSTALVTAWGGLAAVLQERGFPHQEHEGLFPLCETCHQGITTPDLADDFPEPRRCDACHDGDRAPRVRWDGPTPTPTNLEFSHAAHDRRLAAADEEASCATCHRDSARQGTMAVRRAPPEACLQCHAHTAETHLAPERDCTACHIPLTQARELDLDRILAFPAPASHDAEGFLADHAPPPSAPPGLCATCHARESCTRCHLNGDAISAIRTLAPDPRIAVLEGAKLPEYPKPATHEGFEWSWAHGESALDAPAACGTCHARQSCERCHVPERTGPVAALTPVPSGDLRGVRIDPSSRVHDPGWTTDHAAPAAQSGGGCRGCHTMTYCESCHDGPDRPAFHYPNFLQMHGPEAWGNDVECATCHNPDVFCRGCHTSVGRTSEGRLDAAYHSREPFWLFGHGIAARQGLESCRSCHAQSDCVVCHAAEGSWRINPHGPGFAADRLRDADALSCRACHRNGIFPS